MRRGHVSSPTAVIILAPKYLPRLAAIVGLFTRYGLLDFARGQGLLGIEGIDAAGGRPADEGASEAEKAKAFLVGLIIAGLLIASGQMLAYSKTLGLAGIILAGGIGLYVLITVLVTERKKDKPGGG